MNLAEAFVDYLLTHELVDATLGQNLFISRTPANPDTCWWFKLENPASGTKNVTGELLRPNTVSVFYRDRDAKKVYDLLTRLDENLNSATDVVLGGFTVTEIETVGPFTDRDADNQEREVGLLQVTLTTYKENHYVIS